MMRLIVAGALLVLSVAPAAAYHIGSNVGDPAITDPDTPAQDWILFGSNIIVCESDGPNDVRNPNPIPMAGVNGLCTVGPTKVGTWHDGQVVPSPAFFNSSMPPPASGVLVKLDALDPATGSTDIGFDAEVGGYSCFVAPGQALYYEHLYAWWSFDPGPSATPAQQDGFHGHAAMWIDFTSAALAGAVKGTALVDDGGGVGVVAPNGLLAAPCGASPYGGPVFLDDA